MNEYPILSKQQIKILKYFKRKVNVATNKFENRFNMSQDAPVVLELCKVKCVKKKHSEQEKAVYFHITDYGKATIQNYNRSAFRFWFPAVISIIALIFSAISLAIDIIDLFQKEQSPIPKQSTATTSTFHNKVSSFPFPPIP